MDIHIEYERIFGSVQYPTLYDMNDEEYQVLRQEIIDTSPLTYSKNKLPFEDISSTTADRSVLLAEPWHNDYSIRQTTPIDIVNSLYNNSIGKICGLLTTLGGSQINHTTEVEPLNTGRHLFWINVLGRCKAYGYFDECTKNFYIGTNSLISISDDPEYLYTSSYRNRHRLIDKYSDKVGRYYKILKDVKCRSAVAAARYVLGSMVDADLWVDSQGRTLYEIYHRYFFH